MVAEERSCLFFEDHETGEMGLDLETGEETAGSSMSFFEGVHSTNDETGESEMLRPPPTKTTTRRKPFQIPRSALLLEEPRPKPRGETPRVLTLTSTCRIKDHVGRASQNMSPTVFLLPTLFLCPAWAAALCVILEVCIHMWAHKKNQQRNASDVHYRSPLNMITSEFCAYCQSDKLMDRIGKLQDERKLKVDNRKLRYCAYVERMSVVT